MNKQLWIIFLCGGMLVAGSACKNGNTPDDLADKTVKTRHLTIRMSDAAGASVRRMPNAAITDAGSTLTAEWRTGDEATYCNLSRQNQYYDPVEDEDVYEVYTGTLTAVSDGVKSDLNGDVTCTADDYLAVVYPKNATFEYISAGTQYTYNFLLSGQDGTLATLAASYHQQFGRAHVLSVDGTTAEAVMLKMESLLTICKFSFTDGTNAIPVGTLTIRYEDDTSENGKYPQKGKVTVDVNSENSEANAVSDAVAAPLTVTCPSEQSEVYVALLPEIASRTYHFTVTNSTGTYTGTASAWLKKGKYVPATGLKLAKQ